MPRADNEWGDSDPRQFEVSPPGTWLPDFLTNALSAKNPDISSKQVAPSRPFKIEEEIYLPCLQDLRNWYVWARETGRHETYLENIQKLGEKLKLDVPNAKLDANLSSPIICFSTINLHNFRLDQKSYQQLLEQFIEDSETILRSRGSSELINGERIDRYYSQNGEYVLTHYPTADKTTIEKNSLLIAYRQAEEVAIGTRFVRDHDAVLFRQAVTHKQAL